MKSLVLILVLSCSVSFAKEKCSDPYNPGSKAVFSETNKTVALCRYLVCEGLANAGDLEDRVEVCSSSYELVFNKVFERNFSKLLEWWHIHKSYEKARTLCSGVDLDLFNWQFYIPGLDSCE